MGITARIAAKPCQQCMPRFCSLPPYSGLPSVQLPWRWCLQRLTLLTRRFWSAPPAPFPTRLPFSLRRRFPPYESSLTLALMGNVCPSVSSLLEGNEVVAICELLPTNGRGGRGLPARRSSRLLFQVFRVETFSLLPDGQRDRCDLVRQSKAGHRRPKLPSG